MTDPRSLAETPPESFEEKQAQSKSRKRATFDLVKTSIQWDRRSSRRTGGDPNGNTKWTLGILADTKTEEVPGTVVLLSKYSTRNIPLGLQHEQTRGRTTSRGTGTGSGSIAGEANRRRSMSAKKKTADGSVILEPQPDDSLNDPLNWPAWRRDCALLSLGFYCMLGGGMTPILAAGFSNVADTYHVTIPQVALTTGLYMMGMGLGSVFFSPTAILFGKRPVYLAGAVLFVVTSIWCAAAPSYANLAAARVFQGFSVSPVECLPSATIAEIYFLHERAFRIGVYTLLLLGGKNLIPLASAVVIQALDWRWVFWIVAVIVGFGGALLFLFVPETFWDRTPRPKGLHLRSHSKLRRSLSRNTRISRRPSSASGVIPFRDQGASLTRTASHLSGDEIRHIVKDQEKIQRYEHPDTTGEELSQRIRLPSASPAPLDTDENGSSAQNTPSYHITQDFCSPADEEKQDLDMAPNNQSGPVELDSQIKPLSAPENWTSDTTKLSQNSAVQQKATEGDDPPVVPGIDSNPAILNKLASYTTDLRQAPPKPWLKTLTLWNGRLSTTSWWRAAIRPFILFAYPAVLWSSMVYALSVGWLIVLSESVSEVYRNRDTYNFSALGVGLVYMSPFIGGILGTVVAGRVSDIIVRFMARHNDGIYEPEYRLVMAIPIALSTAIGLMGFGWSAEERDAWIVPTIFFGIISFGCTLGSTTAITFCVDSYRQFAGEALVTLNFSKNIFHGLVWSLFFPHWLESSGSKDVFLAIGGIQVACLLLTIPMYIYGKRARMWTVRKGLMDKF